jgi:hypothetical protein
VIRLKRSALSLLLQDREQREHGEQNATPDSGVPTQRSRTTARGGDYGNGFGEQPDSERVPVPAVPGVPAAGGVEDQDDREVVIL